MFLYLYSSDKRFRDSGTSDRARIWIQPGTVPEPKLEPNTEPESPGGAAAAGSAAGESAAAAAVVAAGFVAPMAVAAAAVGRTGRLNEM